MVQSLIVFQLDQRPLVLGIFHYKAPGSNVNLVLFFTNDLSLNGKCLRIL